MTVIDDFSACVDDEPASAVGSWSTCCTRRRSGCMSSLTTAGRALFPAPSPNPAAALHPTADPHPPLTPRSPASQVMVCCLPRPPLMMKVMMEIESNSLTSSSSQVGGFLDDDRHQTSADRDADEEDLALGLPDIQPFEKRDLGEWVALFLFKGIQEDDVRLSAGEVVMVLNKEDGDWLWVRRSGGEEGFVPRSFLCRLPVDMHISGM